MISFDNNATSPQVPGVLAAMRPFLETEFGNPNSVHQVGSRARVAIERARDLEAAVIGARPRKITFCDTGSETNNLAVLGSVFPRLTQSLGDNHDKIEKNIVISEVEHAWVRQPAHWISVLENFDHTRAQGAACKPDSLQGFGKLPVDVNETNSYLTTFSGQKGTSVLYVRLGTKLESIIQGGQQEHTLRPGTENVAQIVGLGDDAAIVIEPPSAQLCATHDYFETRLQTEFGDEIWINFADLPHSPNVSSVRFPGKESKILLIKQDGKDVCSSSGAACNSGAPTVSQALLNMGLTEEQARATLRFSFSQYNTREKIDSAIGVLGEVMNIQAVG